MFKYGFENSLGKHLVAEFFNCDQDLLNNITKLEGIMHHAATASGATVVRSDFYPYKPIGISGIIILKESHLAIHTWPEYEFAAVDLFTCHGTIDFDSFTRKLSFDLGTEKFTSKVIPRGLHSSIENNNYKFEVGGMSG